MTVIPKSLVSMDHVKNVNVSADFYRRLCFEINDIFIPDGAFEPTWALLESHQAPLMVVKASHPVILNGKAVMFYLYFDQIKTVNTDLSAAGFNVGPLEFPF